jgi:hypothetical protein
MSTNQWNLTNMSSSCFKISTEKLRIHLKPILLAIIAIFFLTIKIRFYVTDNFASSRTVGLINDGLCETSLASFEIKNFPISDTVYAYIPVIRSLSPVRKSCVIESNLDRCLDFFKALDDDQKALYTEKLISDRVGRKDDNYLPYDVWIVIFSLLSFWITIMFDYAYVSICNRFNQSDIKNIKRLNICFGICLIAFLITTSYSYSTISELSCGEHYLPYDETDTFCDIVSESYINFASMIIPDDFLTRNIEPFIVVYVIFLVWAMIFHTGDLATFQNNDPVTLRQRDEVNEARQDPRIEMRNIGPVEAEFLLTGRSLDGIHNNFHGSYVSLEHRRDAVKRWKFYEEKYFMKSNDECSICLHALKLSKQAESANDLESQSNSVVECNPSNSQRQDYRPLNNSDIMLHSIDQTEIIEEVSASASTAVTIPCAVEPQELELGLSTCPVHDPASTSITDQQRCNGCQDDRNAYLIYEEVESLATIPGVVQIPCGHRFHKSCIMMWTMHSLRQLTCPVCRSSL